uniref:ANK_REP_REGION domain-containing protein n=1 Tax=Macrostomum lignano TaxID=282301 RepID=A0A1I8FP39_9PLAT
MRQRHSVDDLARRNSASTDDVDSLGLGRSRGGPTYLTVTPAELIDELLLPQRRESGRLRAGSAWGMDRQVRLQAAATKDLAATCTGWSYVTTDLLRHGGWPRSQVPSGVHDVAPNGGRWAGRFSQAERLCQDLRDLNCTGHFRTVVLTERGAAAKPGRFRCFSVVRRTDDGPRERRTGRQRRGWVGVSHALRSASAETRSEAAEWSSADHFRILAEEKDEVDQLHSACDFLDGPQEAEVQHFALFFKHQMDVADDNLAARQSTAQVPELSDGIVSAERSDPLLAFRCTLRIRFAQSASLGNCCSAVGFGVSARPAELHVLRRAVDDGPDQPGPPGAQRARSVHTPHGSADSADTDAAQTAANWGLGHRQASDLAMLSTERQTRPTGRFVSAGLESLGQAGPQEFIRCICCGPNSCSARSQLGCTDVQLGDAERTISISWSVAVGLEHQTAQAQPGGHPVHKDPLGRSIVLAMASTIEARVRILWPFEQIVEHVLAPVAQHVQLVNSSTQGRPLALLNSDLSRRRAVCKGADLSGWDKRDLMTVAVFPVPGTPLMNRQPPQAALLTQAALNEAEHRLEFVMSAGQNSLAPSRACRAGAPPSIAAVDRRFPAPRRFGKRIVRVTEQRRSRQGRRARHPTTGLRAEKRGGLDLRLEVFVDIQAIIVKVGGGWLQSGRGGRSLFRVEACGVFVADAPERGVVGSSTVDLGGMGGRPRMSVRRRGSGHFQRRKALFAGVL